VAFGYVAGVLKHLGCGPNAAFLALSPAWQPQPLMTGWLADPSVLGPGSAGIAPGCPVGFHPALALQ
ncbi:hs1pro-1_N domain-containing protein, partial [Haematococcus lacustris]